MMRDKFFLGSIIFCTLLVAGCMSGSSTNPAQVTMTASPSESYKIITSVPQTPLVSPTNTQKSFLSASISKPVMKVSDKFSIQGESTEATTISLIIKRCKDPNSCSTFDPTFSPKTYYPEVINGKYSLPLNAVEFGPGLFHTIITNPSTGQYTNLRFTIER